MTGYKLSGARGRAWVEDAVRDTKEPWKAYTWWTGTDSEHREAAREPARAQHSAARGAGTAAFGFTWRRVPGTCAGHRCLGERDRNVWGVIWPAAGLRPGRKLTSQIAESRLGD